MFEIWQLSSDLRTPTKMICVQTGQNLVWKAVFHLYLVYRYLHVPPGAGPPSSLDRETKTLVEAKGSFPV